MREGQLYYFYNCAELQALEIFPAFNRNLRNEKVKAFSLKKKQ